MNQNRITITAGSMAELAWLLSASAPAQTGQARKTGNVPIIFYGKIVDQQGQPAPEAKVAVGT